VKNPRLCVVGACNIDLTAYVPRMPAWGETLRGTRFRMGFGGKGANQAVMAAKLGARVAMVAKLGRDAFGQNTLRNFERFGVNTQHVHFTDEAFSGVALITVDPDGRNAIVVVTGANDLLTPADVEAARDVIAASSALICQWEVPLDSTLAALRLARAAGVRTIFNPAPACAELPEEACQLTDILCPNESETALLTGVPVGSVEQAEAAAQILRERGVGAVVVTRGENGSLVVDEDGVEPIPAERVKAVDSTGAGDAFVGSLAYFLGVGLGLREAARRAGAIATRSVLKPGTQTSFPSAEEMASLR